jgi:GT2 family glycosyltransferase
MLKPNYDSATVVIPAYNRTQLLDQTLTSLSKCEGISKAQIIVSDDGSTEPISEVVIKYSQTLNVEYFYQQDLGFRAAKARNIAIAQARNPILIFLDCGMFVCPSFITAHIQAHQSINCPAMVTGINIGFDRDNENALLIEEHLNMNKINSLFDTSNIALRELADPREIVFSTCKDNIHDLRAPWTLMWACNVSVELDVFRILGGFNENFISWGAEDTEFAYRLARCGVNFSLARNAAAIHLPHPKDGKNLQAQSIANFRRETSDYKDPIIRELIEHGDFAVNMSTS